VVEFVGFTVVFELHLVEGFQIRDYWVPLVPSRL
jgi:hypothetical protein